MTSEHAHLNPHLCPVIPWKHSELLASGEVPRRTLDRESTLVTPVRVIPPPRADPTTVGGFPADALARARRH